MPNEPVCLTEGALTAAQQASIPFLIVALKILHEIYGSGHNELQQFEALVAERAGCLGPLDLLMELATRCRGERVERGESPSVTPGWARRGEVRRREHVEWERGTRWR